MSIWNYREAYELRQQQAEAERETARDRDRRHRELRERRQRELEEKIERRLKENARRRAEREAAEEARQERILARVEAERAGVPYSSSGSVYDNPVAEWREAVSEALAVCGGNRQRAACLANKRNPGLRERVIAAANAAR